MQAQPDPVSAYESLKSRYEAHAAEEERRSRGLSILRGATFLIAVGLGIEALAWSTSGHAWWSAAGAGVAFVAFIVAVVVHARVIARKDRSLAGARLCNEGLVRVAGKLADLPARGGDFASETHAYSDDLDLFGSASLFQICDSTTTAMGERRLASWLQQAAPVDEVRRRQAAVRELCPSLEWRTELLLDGMSVDDTRAAGSSVAARADLERLVRWAATPRATWASPGLGVIAWALPSSTLALAITAAPLGLPSWTFLFAGVVTFATSVAYAKRLAGTIETASGLRDALERFGAVLARLETLEAEAPLLVERKNAMRDPDGRGPAAQVRELASIVGFLDARRNDIFRVVVGPLLMWDVQWCLALDRWRGRSGAKVATWLETVADVEALASLGALSFDHPTWCFAELVDGPASFAAEALAHPLIPAKTAIANDVELPPGALLVTGSNMSGKSTLLRSIGLAAVLAQAGGPSCARKLSMSALDVRTSMRVRDSVEEGVSRFYAEVLKLRRVIDGTSRDPEPGKPPVLFLLDEILSGTNSAERHAGARAIVRELVERGAIGAVSTHDLALAALVDELPKRTRLVHFEEQVTDDEMTFDYQLRDGIVRTRNALRLMRLAGLPVPTEDEPG